MDMPNYETLKEIEYVYPGLQYPKEILDEAWKAYCEDNFSIHHWHYWVSDYYLIWRVWINGGVLEFPYLRLIAALEANGFNQHEIQLTEKYLGKVLKQIRARWRDGNN